MNLLYTAAKAYAQKKYQEGVKSVKDTFEQAYQEGELKGRIAEVYECGWSEAKEKYPTYARKRLVELEKHRSQSKERDET